MGFLGIYTALYDYQPQGEGELEIQEGELLFLLEKGEDDWWKAKKKAADEEDEEPVGLVPANYLEEAKPAGFAKALYDYSRQTDEEVSFAEDAQLTVFDTSDPDWTLVGLNQDYGFAPSNYIEISQSDPARSPVSSPRSEAPIARVTAEPEPEASPRASSPTSSLGPAASLAKVLGGGAPAASRTVSGVDAPSHRQRTPEPSDEEQPAPALPRRPPSQQLSPPLNQYTSPQEDEPPGVMESPPHNRTTHREVRARSQVHSPGGYHLYNINEMVSAMGKRKKMPTTLGLNAATGTIMVSPEKSRDGPSQEWTADKMTHYSIEGKHIFLELIRPTKSLDLHAGAKDTAEEIVSVLGEMAGAVRGEGIREVMEAASGAAGKKKGHMLYEFMAQGDDEVTVAAGDDVIILDDTKSEEWWMVRRLKNGNEGVVPSSYVEVTGTTSAEPVSRSGINAGRSTVEQNRLEEERLAKEAAKRQKQKQKTSEAGFNDEPPYIRDVEVAPGMKLPDRGSSLTSDDTGRHDRRPSRSDGKSSKPKPDPAKTRTWTDRSGSFKVEAQFIGLSGGKIHLHKANGVKIAVPITKMAPEDLAYVEKAAGVSLDEEKPLGDLQRKKRSENEAEKARVSSSGASVEPLKRPEYDWFDFFLKAGVGPHLCERYAQNMNKDSMDESNLPDITPDVLRTLGLKEGDILRVMKHLDNLFGRAAGKSNARNGDGEGTGTNGSAGGLFSGARGTLRNNTRKGRPESNRVVSDVVDAKAFEQTDDKLKSPPPESKPTPLTAAPSRDKVQSGFDDDAWEVKRSKEAASTVQPTPTTKTPSSTPAQPQLTGAMAELSLLSPPLQPTVASPQPPPQPAQLQTSQQQPTQPAVPATAPQQQPQPTGASPSFFGQLNPPQAGLPGPQPSSSQPMSMQPQNSNFPSMPQLNVPRQRPQAPQQPLSPGSLLPPPPRPLSAPQNFQQRNQFGPPPLQPQLTGIPYASALQAPAGQSLNDLSQQRQQQLSQQHQLHSQPTGFSQQGPGFAAFSSGLMPQQTGFQSPGQQFSGQQQLPYINGNAAGSPFADPRPPFQPQPTGFGSFNQQQGLPPGGINSVLPTPLQPQPTGFQPQPQQTGFLQPQQTGYQQQQQPAGPFQQPQQAGFQQQPSQGFQQPQQAGFVQSQPNGFGGPSSSSSFQAPPMPPMPQQAPIPAPLQPQKTGPPPPVRFGVSDAAKKLTPQPTGRRANLAHATAQNPFGF